jgi:hypothetical protein
MSKRVAVGYGSCYADHHGQVVDSFHILSPQYGSSGIEPRLQINQPLVDIDLPEEEFEMKYGGDERISALRREIKKTFSEYKSLTNFIRNSIVNNIFCAGFNYEQFLNGSEDDDSD